MAPIGIILMLSRHGHIINAHINSCHPAGRGGRVAASGSTLSSFVAKSIATKKMDDQNPREAFLKHAKDASENPFWISPAYEK